jgi:glutaredoxin
MREITMYTAPWCSKCKTALETLSSHNIEVIIKDLSDEGTLEKATELGVRSLPTFELEGVLYKGLEELVDYALTQQDT